MRLLPDAGRTHQIVLKIFSYSIPPPFVEQASYLYNNFIPSFYGSGGRNIFKRSKKNLYF
jgi:hypothetical protein